MSELSKKLERIRRIHTLETSQMNVLIGDLARIDAELASHFKRLNELQLIKHQGLVSTQLGSIELLTQNGIWIDSINRSIMLAHDIISKCQSERRDAQSRVMEQRTRVRGLEILVDQLRLEFDADAMTQQMLMADENALKNFARN
ncbi:MAG: hypothetical protein KDB00_08325 [Planctomycetales bacterium]|nr:hypothetical protein [Planctomycetales bacterium]